MTLGKADHHCSIHLSSFLNTPGRGSRINCDRIIIITTVHRRNLDFELVLHALVLAWLQGGKSMILDHSGLNSRGTQNVEQALVIQHLLLIKTQFRSIMS